MGWAEEVGRSRTYSTGDNTTGYTYGYLFWVGPNEKWFYANGKYEQLCVIVPDKKAVVTVNCDEKRPGDLVMHALARTILPRL